MLTRGGKDGGPGLDVEPASDALLLALPKAELHVHLDGSLRAATMAELARERRVEMPWRDAEDLEIGRASCRERV